MFEFIKKFFTKAEAKVEETVAPYKVEIKAEVAKVEAEVKEVAVKAKTAVKKATTRKPKAK